MPKSSSFTCPSAPTRMFAGFRSRWTISRLWAYAISQFAQLSPNLEQAKVQWEGDYGLLNREKQGKRERYDLVQNTPEGYRYYFGVTEDGIHGAWKQLVGQDDE